MSLKSNPNTFLVIILSTSILFGCEQKTSVRETVPEETFVKLYIDLEFSKVAFTSKPDSLKDTSAYQDSLVHLFKAYHVSPKAYQNQLRDYAEHPLQWQAVQNLANNRVRKMREEQDSIKRIREKRYQLE